METAFALGSLGAGLVLLVVAVSLRLWSLTPWSAPGSCRMAPAGGASPRSAAALAILVGRPRRAAAVALVALEAEDAVVVGRPERDRIPELRIRDVGRIDADAHLILDAYSTSGSERRSALWNAIDTVGESVARNGLTGRLIRWPARVLIPVAIIALILSALVIVLVAPSAIAWAAAVGTLAALAAIIVVPTRIQRPTAAAAPLLADLRARREAVRRGDSAVSSGSAASVEDVVLFGRATRLRQTTIGPDGVTLWQLTRATDPGAPRGRIISNVIEFLSWWS
ncbi:hypothetical protein GCM10010988_31030 [Cnuibacter physcomitrellae]|uniref:Uncharacterized protein n=1 Tax=Cnuibacter physcomitrellae TaxID=1619308 RepID=A0A1X9LGL4_9MICO|nr:hypothetical protein [Cnuibacter physcomitrellae]ARJ04345.1 hypothetical protein B5808_03215 [Cnuibacter physcomitrellae]GGI40826.1 hypothetical protein GCM10010988_31030 [Cnuibacter physcomitrellae]